MSALTAPSPTDDVAKSLAEGYTLPTAWYTDPEIFARERERIVGRSWNYVGHAGRLISAGDRVCTSIGDVPIVLVRDQDGALYGLVNVCRHRQHAVVTDDVDGRVLRCRYHGWTYNLDGTLRNAPRSQASPGFSTAGIALKRIELGTWGPLVFARLGAEGPPLAEILGDLPQRVKERGVRLAGKSWRAQRRHELACNWKVYVENACECYHCSLAHPALARVIDVRADAYALDAQEWYLGQSAPRRAADGRSSKDTDPYAFQFYYVWPNLFLSTVTGSGSYAIHRLEPLSVDSCRLVIDYYFADGASDDAIADAVAANTRTLTEDNALVQSVQVGLRSGAIPRGRVMLPSEGLVSHFQGMVVRELG